MNKLTAILLLPFILNISACTSVDAGKMLKNIGDVVAPTQSPNSASAQSQSSQAAQLQKPVAGQGSSSQRQGIDMAKLAELKKEIAAEIAGSSKNGKGGSQGKKLEVIYGTVLTASDGKVNVHEDKKSNGLITVHLIDAGMTNDDVDKFPRGTRVKVSHEEGGVFNSITKVTGKEAQIKILNRSDCLQHYGTDGAIMCFKKFPN